MYVPGQLCDVDNVLIDIGTGYYVELVGITQMLLEYVVFTFLL